MTRSHKIRLDPTFKQMSYFRKACGIARFAWNWGLAQWEEKYKAKVKTSAFDLKKEFNAIKSIEFPWTYEVTKYASQQPFISLQKAFQAFFNKKAKYPKFKKKGRHDSFYIGGDQLKVKGKLDRDLNAARCLEQLLSTVSFTGIDACGQDGPVIMLKTLLQPAWQKQELSPV